MNRGALLALALFGCGGSLPRATEADARRANLTVAALDAARERYVDKCSGCHSLRIPDEHRAADWPSLVDEMAEDARLEGDDRAVILQYLQAFARPD